MPIDLPLVARVAIADDDATQRRLLQLLVEHLGHEVVCVAANGRCAIDQFSRLEIDVVLMDLDMPEIDGLEAAEHISLLGIPVVLISGVADAEHLVIEHEPIVSFLSKPISAPAVGEAIYAALKVAD